jgi:hypothetical protein
MNEFSIFRARCRKNLSFGHEREIAAFAEAISFTKLFSFPRNFPSVSQKDVGHVRVISFASDSRSSPPTFLFGEMNRRTRGCLVFWFFGKGRASEFSITILSRWLIVLKPKKQLWEWAALFGIIDL